MNEHADRDHSEEPVDLTGFEAAYANAPHAPGGGQGDPVDEQRHQRYAEAFRDPGAFVERRRVQGVYPNSDRDARETLTEWQARAVMAVADAELAELRAEVEIEADQHRRWADKCIAAERALADERAKVARVEAQHPRGETWYEPGEGEVTTDDDQIDDGCQSCRVPWPCPTAAALAGPEPEATEGGA